ncbi:DNA primase [Mesorhizobium sp.]|uniref:DNA primase n=5 Tax=unclassified Mesorhizobium TaxID=325217 RepID=UPI000FE75FB2|nr:DNA primase [Mesorhizobium sp.]RWI75881.1 MAG: DNA primase [Mesorhizobium sp.]RWI80855.1 MAG: DNA primase [Mesorhizobium sp.]RWJ04322.1 MAG: DNA primase [Mesorhizobium sp.]RWJ37504.1 MAG: DNA primase [Mesorhizobium sp.]RWJ53724.1 MAG: DNA primase [Mesorhizobium sp.]
MRFPPAFLDEIRDRVPISSVIGQRVAWDRKKTNAPRGDYWACCPFHGEKSPSFHCEDKKGRYHCFGCSVSGDHFKFLTELDGMSFPEAVEKIADMAGVPMPVRDAQEERREKELTEIMEMATAFFQERLQGPEGAKARAYLRDRGLTPATQQSFRLGYAPDSRNALKEHLAANGVPKADIEACGLVRHGDDVPVSYDWFRDRIMFPIPDSRGKIIAFGGRALAADALAKYMNSPDTELFHKGNVLYNFARARQALGKGALAKGGTVIAVEGYMDVIALAQAGFENVVAPLGTALTENQLELLWRMAGEPVLCFDGDQAGLKAAWRAADMALPAVQAGRSVRFALLPEGKDPDDLVKADGPDAFRAVLSEARPLADLLWVRETAGGIFDTPERRAELEKTLRELTSRIRDESLRYHYQQEMRERVLSFFGTQRSARQGYQGGRQDARPGGRFQGKGSAPGGQFARGGNAGGRTAITESLGRSALVKRGSEGMSVREATIIAALVNHPALIDENFEHVEFLDLANTDLKRLHAAILDAMAHDMANDRDAVIATIQRAGCGEIWARVVALIKRARQWPALETAGLDDARDAFSQALHLQRSARTLHKELKQAEAALASDPTDENYRHLVEIQAQFRDVQATEALIDGFGVSSGRAGRV